MRRPRGRFRSIRRRLFVWRVGRIWWIQYYAHGQQIRESSHSESRAEAEDMLQRRSTERLESEGNSFVTYFIEDETGPIKIGISYDAVHRLETLQLANPRRLKLLGYLPANREEILHTQFAHARIRGEWFHPIPELLHYIKEEPLFIKP